MGCVKNHGVRQNLDWQKRVQQTHCRAVRNRCRDSVAATVGSIQNHKVTTGIALANTKYEERFIFLWGVKGKAASKIALFIPHKYNKKGKDSFNPRIPLTFLKVGESCWGYTQQMCHTYTFDMSYNFDRKGVSEDKHNNMNFVYIIFIPHLKDYI